VWVELCWVGRRRSTGERFLDLTVSRPYTPSPPTGGTDEYRCMVIDPRLTTPTFLTGSQFRPQNEPIVHHAIVFAVPAAAAATARAKDAETEAEGWTCFGSARRRTGVAITVAGVTAAAADARAGFGAACDVHRR
jgi:hypothetical protein